MRKGKNKAAVIQRAHILLKSDEGQTDRAISEMLYISEQTVRRTRVRYATASLKEALEDKPHPARKPEMDDTQTAYLVALACSDPPAGQAKWTMELLAAQLVEGGIVEHISPETVRLVLKKNKLKPWQVKSWCIPTITPEFLRRMENILALYAQPYNPQRPLVCFDEKSYQLLAHSQPPVTAQVGQARRQDYEYRRQGTRNLFLFDEPDSSVTALVDRLLTKPHTPPIRSHAVEPEGVVWGPSVDLGPIDGLPIGFWEKVDKTGNPEWYWPAQYGDPNNPDNNFGFNACWVLAAYALLSYYADSIDGMKIPDIDEFMTFARENQIYTGETGTIRDITQLLKLFEVTVISTTDVQVGDIDTLEEHEQMALKHISNVLGLGVPLAMMSSQFIGGSEGVYSEMPNLENIITLAEGGTKHWIVITGLSSGGGFIRIYNPYLNRIEYYSLDEFTNSIPTETVKVDELEWEDSLLDLVWVDPEATSSGYTGLTWNELWNR